MKPSGAVSAHFATVQNVHISYRRSTRSPYEYTNGLDTHPALRRRFRLLTRSPSCSRRLEQRAFASPLKAFRHQMAESSLTSLYLRGHLKQRGRRKVQGPPRRASELSNATCRRTPVCSSSDGMLQAGPWECVSRCPRPLVDQDGPPGSCLQAAQNCTQAWPFLLGVPS